MKIFYTSTKQKILLISIATIALLPTGCGETNQIDVGKPGSSQTLPSTQQPQATNTVPVDRFTKNTNRIAEDEPIRLATDVARTVYPGPAPAGSPYAAVFLDSKDWRAALVAASLASPATKAPTLLTSSNHIPLTTAKSFTQLQPLGIDKLNSTQAIAIDNAPLPRGAKAMRLQTNGNSYQLAQKVDQLQRSFHRGQLQKNVIIVAVDQPAFAAPAAAWIAKSGDSVLFVDRNEVPTETLAALKTSSQLTVNTAKGKARVALSMYLLGPTSVISKTVEKTLTKFGSVKRIEASNPTANAIAFAKYADGPFGWGITDPGHGLVFATTTNPLAAILSAPLSSSGTYGPLLLLDRPSVLSQAVRSYLLDIQPGYQQDPVRGVYNRGWIIGTDTAIQLTVQNTIDSLLEIIPVQTAQKPGSTQPPPSTQTSTAPPSTSTITTP